VARRRRGGRGGALLGVRGGGGVFFDGGAEFVEGAIILGVFGGDALGDRLSALKLGGAVKEAALLAAVELEAALGALAVGVEAAGEHGAAIGAAGASDGADHARGARAELIGARTAVGWFAVVRAVFLFLFFRVAIAAVIVLAIHRNLRTAITSVGREFAGC